MRILIAIAFLLLISTCTAHAQTVPPLELPDAQPTVTHPILDLDAGDRAPRAGMLIDDDDLVSWRQMIERLAYELGAQRSLATATCDLRVHEETLRTAAARAELALRDGLWTSRVEELAAQLDQARGRQGPAWYEQPLLWTVVGAILGGAVVGVIAGAVR
jgi:hypothetical protein